MNISSIIAWIRQRWLRLAIIFLLVIPTMGFFLASGALMIFTYRPADYSKMVMPTLDPHARHVFVIAHGVHDTPESWINPLKRLLQRQLEGERDDAQVIALDWRPYSDSTFRCAVDGKRIGGVLGKRMASSAQLTSVHLIGHSCGSFVVFGLCEALKQARDDVRVQSTYLDPVSIYGGLNWDYGLNHFGLCADFSDAYIDRDDGVPGSNELQPHTHTFDITAARKKTTYSLSPHVWPTHYYQQLVRSGEYPALRRDAKLSQRYPSGVLELVSESPAKPAGQ